MTSFSKIYKLGIAGICSWILVFASVYVSGGLGRDEHKGHDHKGDDHSQHEHGEHKKKSPKTLKKLWQAIQKKHKHLEKTIHGEKLDKVHDLAFEIRDLLKAMPKKSKILDKEKMKSLIGSVKRANEVVDLIHEYADGKDQKNTEKQSHRLTKLLSYVKTLYPKNALVSEKKGHGHEGHGH